MSPTTVPATATKKCEGDATNTHSLKRSNSPRHEQQRTLIRLVSPSQTSIYVMCPTDHDIWFGGVESNLSDKKNLKLPDSPTATCTLEEEVDATKPKALSRATVGSCCKRSWPKRWRVILGTTYGGLFLKKDSIRCKLVRYFFVV